MTAALWFIAGCWIALAIYWAVAARSAKPSAQRQAGVPRVLHLVTLTAAGALLIGPRWPYPLSLLVVPHGATADVGGGVLCLCGLVVALWARRTLGGNWSSAVTFKQGHELIVRGPYNYVRHPIYTGLLLMALGTAIAIGRLHAWIGLLLCIAGFWVKLRQEEALMVREFPDHYPAYRRRVKALIPFVI
jgi:protein-S-isoprenylcysteine O-methyltransferase Ste14